MVQRQALRGGVAAVEQSLLVFVDETGAKTSMAREGETAKRL